MDRIGRFLGLFRSLRHLGNCPVFSEKDESDASALEKIVAFGPLFFSAALLVFVYLPLVVSKPTDVGTGLNYFFDTLMFAGAALLLAEALPQHDVVREVKERRLQFALRGKE